MHESIVGARPDQTLLQRRLGHGEDGVVIFRAGVVYGDGAAGGLLLALVVAREVARDGFPVETSVGGAEEPLAAVVKDVGIVRGYQQRGSPLETVFEARSALAIAQDGGHADDFRLAGALVEHGQQALVIAREDDVRIGRVRRDVSSFAAAHGVPVLALDAAAFGAAGGNGHAGIILLRAV